MSDIVRWQGFKVGDKVMVVKLPSSHSSIGDQNETGTVSGFVKQAAINDYNIYITFDHDGHTSGFPSKYLEKIKS